MWLVWGRQATSLKTLGRLGGGPSDTDWSIPSRRLWASRVRLVGSTPDRPVQKGRELASRHLMETQGHLVLLRTWDAQGPRELMFSQIGRIMDQLLFGGLQTISFAFQGETAVQTSQPFPPPEQLGKCGPQESAPAPTHKRLSGKPDAEQDYCGGLASPPPPLTVISTSVFSCGIYVFRQHSSLFPNVSQF